MSGYQTSRPNCSFSRSHTLLRIVYHVLADGTTYHELGGDYYDRQHRQRLTRRAIQLLQGQGYRVTLVSVRTSEVRLDSSHRANRGTNGFRFTHIKTTDS